MPCCCIPIPIPIPCCIPIFIGCIPNCCCIGCCIPAIGCCCCNGCCICIGCCIGIIGCCWCIGCCTATMGCCCATGCCICIGCCIPIMGCGCIGDGWEAPNRLSRSSAGLFPAADTAAGAGPPIPPRRSGTPPAPVSLEGACGAAVAGSCAAPLPIFMPAKSDEVLLTPKSSMSEEGAAGWLCLAGAGGSAAIASSRNFTTFLAKSARADCCACSNSFNNCRRLATSFFICLATSGSGALRRASIT
mmetsp:Transcript_37932/g.59182  ORF Transcript_37932/g.59182 Transcript_37932/m.59182 type:complete len:246 (+) Transcript_37932:456-1193(+)